LAEVEEVRGVAVANLVFLRDGLERLAGEFANRLEHRETLVPAPHEVVVDERRERLQDVVTADCLCSVEREPAGEDGQAGEECSCLLVEQVAAPLDRCPKRSLPLRSVTGAAR